MVEKELDILIVGGGLTGAALLLALAGKGFRVLLIDNKPLSEKADINFDARSLALSPASIRILEKLNIWPLLENKATSIRQIHVSEQRQFAATRLQAKPGKALGYVVEMPYINQALQQLLNKDDVLAPAQLSQLDEASGIALVTTPNGQQFKISAKLVVAADGTHSAVRQLLNLKTKTHDYHQQAIVANIGLARTHDHVAYERFTPSGPLAMLPLTDNRASLVWALPPQQAQQLMIVSEKEFLKALQQAFGYRLGRFCRAGERMLFPLKQVLMPTAVKWPFVFVGNAVHTLHPVAGQGFNLGLRDVAALAQCIMNDGLNEAMLANYSSMRRHDQRAIVTLTDGLIKIFTSRLPGMALARNAGLMAMEHFTVLKKLLRHYTQGFGGITPDLVCGIDLEDGQ
ncbi:2-octaprenyl-6-methoxyphenyl hydroxylase [Legionella jordanis]|uniref:2-octaprenyl-6-methoxyphenol hydroxylase n=1 Tax=Legionella jordanis TaxID=456 RepID=A0A0W0VCP0_9GAMM|nr:2-octaprenyl-6-methoxyphenyl hydroxylase [Legionella jordanis]KTD17899.1 2-octaprenyl-6-methoxyphenol hydroxylase [Legionella jordanis]RMX02402.1 2-octaprenyl-6-methoxyphenyl hydroxylase [Legionella jordanis]VEH14010.1 2-octaprenyl-6-methoxyphenol hydroxylase [Legionella jordanis]HAT8713869.1 2-octaprenyl-6-methoxyphenyl hydroxylase [Legionella jordanis]